MPQFPCHREAEARGGEGDTPEGSQQGRSRPGWGIRAICLQSTCQGSVCPEEGRQQGLGLSEPFGKHAGPGLGLQGWARLTGFEHGRGQWGLGRVDALQGWVCHPSPLVSTSVTSGKWFNLSLATESTTPAYALKS